METIANNPIDFPFQKDMNLGNTIGIGELSLLFAFHSILIVIKVGRRSPLIRVDVLLP
jgi:hypothetical protein